jgi:hypothetical protein
MSRSNALALVSLVMAFGFCGDFKRTSAAQDKLGNQNTESDYERIQAALDVPTEMDFSETPLKDVVDALKLRHRIEIQLDAKAMTDAGASLDMPITIKLKGVSLRAALRLMLGEHDLRFVYESGVLLITAKEPTELRQYNVADLLGHGPTDGFERAVRMALPRVTATKQDRQVGSGRDRRTTSIAATSADGDIAFVQGVLLLRTSGRGHSQVDSMLEELRFRIKTQKEHESQTTGSK